MKQKFFFLSLFFAALSMNAQFTMEDHDGSLITDGQVLIFGGFLPDDPSASYEIYVNNPSTTEAIRMKAEFVSAINADGSLFEICFGLCYTGITIGQTFPPNANFIEVLPGEQTPEGNHLANAEAGDGVNPVEYVFRFYQVDVNGDETGDDLTLTYKYDPLLGVNDNELNVNVFLNSRTNQVTIEVAEELEMKVYNLQGRLMKSEKLNVGRQQINMSDLSAQMYILHFTNNSGLSHTEKVVVN